MTAQHDAGPAQTPPAPVRKKISAIVIADSVSPYGDRITTLECTFPRFLLPEFNTHRAFSRNSASSRARSVQRTIQEVRDDPFVPVHWPSERRGMAGGEPVTAQERLMLEDIWKNTASYAVRQAMELTTWRAHKSLVNRILEPFMWHTVVVTATDWDGFFAQRLALLEDGTPAAELHFYDLARAMRRALDEFPPVQLNNDEWHLPYVRQRDHHYVEDLPGDNVTNLLKISVARCAGVSYLNQDADRPLERDIALYDRLRTADPPHWSPFEHVARPVTGRNLGARDGEFTEYAPSRYNLSGWASLRWFLESGVATLVE